MNYVKYGLKALVAFLVAGTGAGAVAATDNGITYGEWWVVAATAVAAAGTVFGVTNGPKPQARAEAWQGPHDGL
jgi:hypothetical protein